MRIDRYISQGTGTPRSHVWTGVRAGQALVNGVEVRDPAKQVTSGVDEVVFRGKPVRPFGHRVLMLHKPVGLVSGQAEDGYAPAVSLFTAANRWAADHLARRFHPGQLRGLAPAGRLDIDSTGLLVLTQDGRIAKLLIGDESQVEKEYLVRVAYGRGDRLPDSDLQRLRHGLELDGRMLRPARVSWANEDQLRFVLREGRKRQIRRMCEMVGLQVLGLKRVRIGSVALGQLPVGQWRYLGPHERFI